MLKTLKLLLPAIIPSWRFFDIIAPSPRIEFALLAAPAEVPAFWQEFRPRPAQLSACGMLKRLFWNPRWNESLFLVSCAERLMENPTDHSSREIMTRIKAELERDATAASYLKFRLVLLSRHGARMQREITFISPAERFSGGMDS
jgi:hypothetical protein